MDNSQIERDGVYKVASFFTIEFDWIAREQTLLDYGIDMQIEIKENGIPTGVLIALQIKSGNSHCTENKSENTFTYRGKLRHLEYWQNYSDPVLFVWYRPFDKNLYWQLVSYESEYISRNKNGWSLVIPSGQLLSNNSKEEILSKCYNSNNFKVVNEDNISINIATRYRLKIIIFETRKYLIKRIIQNIHDKYIELYSEQHGIFNSLSIFYYRKNTNDMYFCRTQWNNKDYDYKLDFVKKNDEIRDIEIEWDNDSDYFNKYFLDNSNLISKSEYINICNKSMDLCNKFIEASISKDIDELEAIIFDFHEEIKEEFNLVTNENYDFSEEVKQLSIIRMSAVDWLHNISIIFQNKSRDKVNKYFAFKGYMDDLQKDIEKYNNEKQKMM